MYLTHSDFDSTSADNLLAAFDQVNSGPPGDLDGYVRQRLSDNNLPPPWATWALVGLSKYRQRQLWARELAFHHLMVDVPGFQEALNSGQYLKDFVSSDPEWVFQLNFIEGVLDLHNRVTGEVITLSMRDYEADCGFHRLAFKEWFTKSRPRVSSDWRLRLGQLHPLGDSLGFSMEEVASATCCEPSSGDEEDEFEQLPEKVLARSDSINAFCEAWETPGNRIWLSAPAGDWIALSEAATENGMTEIATLARERTDECRSARLNVARDLCGKLIEHNALPIAPHALYVVGELAPEKARQLVRKAFAGGRESALSAFHYVRDTQDASWCPEIYRLLTRHLREDHSRNAFGATSLAGYLIGQKYRVSDVIETLANDERTVAHAALLAVEHLPDAARGILERALRSSKENSWCRAAAILAVLADPRSEQMCLSAIKDTQNPRLALYCHMALYTMWGKERLIVEQESIRQVERCIETGRVRRCKRACDRGCAWCRDPLAERFSRKVAKVAQHVLTYREQVIAASLPPANEEIATTESGGVKT